MMTMETSRKSSRKLYPFETFNYYVFSASNRESSLSTLLALSPLISSGQEAEEKTFGFLEMVNLVSLETPTYFAFGGYKIAGGDAIPAGESSGYATINTNDYSFTVSNAGARLNLVSLLAEPFSSAQINGKPGPSDGRQPFLFPVKIGDKISLEVAEAKMNPFEIDADIHFLCFLFSNPKTGSAELSIVKNEKLEYHPPLNNEKEESTEE